MRGLAQRFFDVGQRSSFYGFYLFVALFPIFWYFSVSVLVINKPKDAKLQLYYSTRYSEIFHNDYTILPLIHRLVAQWPLRQIKPSSSAHTKSKALIFILFSYHVLFHNFLTINNDKFFKNWITEIWCPSTLGKNKQIVTAALQIGCYEENFTSPSSFQRFKICPDIFCGSIL